MYFYLTLFLIISLTFDIALGQNAILSITPGRLEFVKNQEAVTINCQPVVSSFDSIYSIAIKRSTSSTTNNIVATVAYVIATAQTKLTWQDTDVERRVDNSETVAIVSPVEDAQLKYKIPINKTECKDEAVYSCYVNGGKNTITVQNSEVSKNLTVEVRPEYMNQMQPNSIMSYNAGDDITFSCTASIGDYPTPLEVRWCLKRTSDSFLQEASNLGNITKGNVESDGECQYKRTSTFTYTVVSQDTNTQVLCQITAPGDNTVCGFGSYRSSINITTSAAITPAPGGQGTEPTSNAGIIAGSVLGGIAVLILIGLIVYFVVFRKRSPGESYKTREDMDGKENPEGPVYSVPDKNRRMRGNENAAMTETHTKPRSGKDHDSRPHRHENAGRHRDGYDNPTMNDRDGTPEPRNHPGGPMGSAV